jgi:endonuclease III
MPEAECHKASLDDSRHGFGRSTAMSKLTQTIMGVRRRRHPSAWEDRLAAATARLVDAYGTPTLGNFRNPVKEIFYILLSARTTERLYQRAHSGLFREFPTISHLATAKVSAVERCVAVAGFGGKRARHIVRIAKLLHRDLGESAARKLATLDPQQAFDYLTRLPGVGPKSALCVIMCSLGHDVFPVDINVQRILERMGVIRKGLPHYRAQQIAPGYIPAGASKQLHVGLVQHGRKICLPRNPKCASCMLLDMCRLGQRTQAAPSRTRRSIS